MKKVTKQSGINATIELLMSTVNELIDCKVVTTSKPKSSEGKELCSEVVSLTSTFNALKKRAASMESSLEEARTIIKEQAADIEKCKSDIEKIVKFVNSKATTPSAPAKKKVVKKVTSNS